MTEPDTGEVTVVRLRRVWRSALTRVGRRGVTLLFLALLALTVAGSLVVANQAGSIVGWFGAAEAMFGWTAVEVVGRPVTVLMPARYRAAHAAGLARVTATGRSELAGRLILVDALHRDGHEFPVQILI